MKTPMQELIEQLKEERDLHGYERAIHYQTAIEFAESMLEKEEEVMCQFAFEYQNEYSYNGKVPPIQDYYNETFKTKER